MNDIEKIKSIKNKILEDIKLTKNKLKISSTMSLVISFSIMAINLIIICLSLWAIALIAINPHGNIQDIAFPIVVAICTVFIFIMTIIITIYKLKSKMFFYKTILEEYQYLIIKINEENISLESAKNILEEIKNKNFEYQKIKYKKIIKKVLGG